MSNKIIKKTEENSKMTNEIIKMLSRCSKNGQVTVTYDKISKMVDEI
jgi:predicted nucleotidyltransferase